MKKLSNLFLILTIVTLIYDGIYGTFLYNLPTFMNVWDLLYMCSIALGVNFYIGFIWTAIEYLNHKMDYDIIKNMKY